MTTIKIDIKELEFGIIEQKESVLLRSKILREPLGLNFNDEELLSEDSNYHLGAFYQNHLAGILLLKPMNIKEVKMRQVAVAQDMQKMGVGKQLVHFSEKFAIEKGYKTICLHARKSALLFYLKLNYCIEGNEFIEVGIPHYKMTKKL